MREGEFEGAQKRSLGFDSIHLVEGLFDELERGKNSILLSRLVVLLRYTSRQPTNLISNTRIHGSDPSD
jgi:hypothetical protein